MNNIEQYRKRFYNLMESTMGDVRPIISEQPTQQPRMTDTSYFMNKIVVSDTQAILNKFIGKTMYLYNKNGTCQSSGGKNVVFIDGKPAKVEEYTSGVPGKLNFIELFTENKDGVVVPRITDGKTGIIITFTNAYDMVKDESGGAPLVSYSQKDEEGYQEQGFNRMDDKGNVKRVGEEGGMLQYSYDFATKKWSDSSINKLFQPCLLNALQTALPNGLKTPERTDTDFGYVPGQDDLPKA
jgi:hypothetical protein